MEELGMLISIISIIANILFIVVLNLNLFTDRAPLPDGHFREYQRSAVARLSLSGDTYLFIIQIALAAVSIVTSILILVGVNNKIVKLIQIISSVASLVLFIIIMISTSGSHTKYA